VLVGALAIGAICFDVAAAPAARAASADDPALLQADRDLVQAATRADKAALDKLLDADFMWTDATGKLQGKDDVLRDPSKPALADETGSDMKRGSYGDVAALMLERGNVHVLRLWVKRPTGWQALAYHEVRVNPQPPGPSGPGVNDCENPCKSLPFKPRNADEQAVIDSWQALERAVTDHDAEAWAPHMASEFALINANGVQTKADRMATLNRQKAAGAATAPPPLVSANMFGFGDTIVMTCLHQPYTGKQIRITRLWTKRDGKWQMAKSYQTTVQDSVPQAP